MFEMFEVPKGRREVTTLQCCMWASANRVGSGSAGRPVWASRWRRSSMRASNSPSLRLRRSVGTARRKMPSW